jgi:hypothetical protein
VREGEKRTIEKKRESKKEKRKIDREIKGKREREEKEECAHFFWL